MSKMRTRVFGAVATILCLVTLGARSARGQGELAFPEWIFMSGLTLPPSDSVTSIYFFDPLHGIAAYHINDSINDTTRLIFSQIYYSSKRDAPWNPSTMPSGIKFIREIRFIQGKLYAASEGTDALVSSDSGRSWQFSTLGFDDANDIYADGLGTIRALHDPMKVFARLDTMHCMAQGITDIFISNDGGLNWVSSGVPIGDTISRGAFADRCQNVYLCPNSNGTAFRSSDFGQTWRDVITGSGPFPELLSGASTVSYVADTGGFYRSTDDGLTWTSVVTVDSGPRAFFVWGPMGEDVALGMVYFTGDYTYPAHIPIYASGIWFTTNGGLDDLHSGINMTDSNGAPLEQQDTMNVPWQLASTCQPFKIPIALWADVPGLSEKVTMSDSLGDFALLGVDSVTLPVHQEDTLWMQYDPHHPVSNVVLTFENHWNCSDWTETRTVHVDAIPSARITPPPMFAASCIADTEAALIRADSCETLVIDSVFIPPYLGQNFFVTTHLPDTTSISANNLLHFAFSANSMNGTISDRIIIYGHYLGMDSLLDDYFYFPHSWGQDTNFAFFYTMVPITLHVLSGGPFLVSKDSSLNAGARFLCDTRDTFVVIRNPGCDTVCVDTVTLSGMGFAIAGGNGPTCLAPAASDTIWLGIETDTTGHPTTNTASLHVASNASSPLAPIVLTRSIIYPSDWSVNLSPPATATAGSGITFYILQSGGLPANVTALDFTISYNDDILGFDDLGDPALTYSKTPDGVAHVHFHFAPVPAASVLDSLRFTAFAARDSETNLSLEDIVLANGEAVPSDCIASTTASSTRFTLLTQCGTQQLSSYLRTGNIYIDKIDPNPVTNTATLTLYSALPSPVSGRLSIFDAIGREVMEQRVTISPGGSSQQLDVLQLPAGLYTTRLNIAGSEATETFIKE